MQDTFGLRQRLTVAFAPPTWLPLHEIRAACSRLPPNARRPGDFLASLLFPLLFLSLRRDRESLVAPGAAPPGYTFWPNQDDGAQDLVDQKFDFRMAKQKETFLVHDQHDTAKYHGKMRTKFDRLVLAIHYVHHICIHFLQKQAAGVDILGWILSFAVNLKTSTFCTCPFSGTTSTAQVKTLPPL